MVLTHTLKRCTQCGEIFDAEKDPETDWDDLQCPYLDCDGEGTIVKADMSDRYDQWMHDKHKQYIYWRGKARVAVKDLYWRPVRRYNAFKRSVKAFLEWFGNDTPDTVIDLDGDLSEEEIQKIKEQLDDSEEMPVIGSDPTEGNHCPNCKSEAEEIAEVGEDEYRCEHCIGGT